MSGALFWFAPLQRGRMRSPGRKVGASAVGAGPFWVRNMGRMSKKGPH